MYFLTWIGFFDHNLKGVWSRYVRSKKKINTAHYTVQTPTNHLAAGSTPPDPDSHSLILQVILYTQSPYNIRTEICAFGAGPPRVWPCPLGWNLESAHFLPLRASATPHQLMLQVWMKSTACRHSFVLLWCSLGVLSISPFDKLPFNMTRFFLSRSHHTWTAHYYFCHNNDLCALTLWTH